MGDFRMRPGRSGRDAAPDALDRLLDDPDTPPAGSGGVSTEALGRLLRVAAGPASSGELAGEEAALAAFRSARSATGRATLVGRRLTTGATAWIAALVATTTAGVAFAAVTLDRPTDSPRPPVFEGSTTPRPSGSPTPGTGSSTPGWPVVPSPSGSGTGALPDVASPLAGGRPWYGLCTAWLSGNGSERGRLLRSRPYRELVAAAGGAGTVESYCRAIVARKSPAAGPNPPKPSRPGPPSSPPHGNGQGQGNGNGNGQGNGNGGGAHDPDHGGAPTIVGAA